MSFFRGKKPIMKSFWKCEDPQKDFNSRKFQRKSLFKKVALNEICLRGKKQKVEWSRNEVQGLKTRFSVAWKASLNSLSLFLSPPLSHSLTHYLYLSFALARAHTHSHTCARTHTYPAHTRSHALEGQVFFSSQEWETKQVEKWKFRKLKRKRKGRETRK